MPRQRKAPVPSANGIRGHIDHRSTPSCTATVNGPQVAIVAMAEAVAADGRVPIRARLAAACAVHRQRWGLPPLPADADAVAAAYARRPRPPS